MLIKKNIRSLSVEELSVFLKKHGIKHRAVVHLKGKKNMLKKTTGGKRKSKRSSKKRGGSSCRSTVKGGDFWQFFN